MSGMIQLMSALIFIPLAVRGSNSEGLEPNHLLCFSTEKAVQLCRNIVVNRLNNSTETNMRFNKKLKSPIEKFQE